MATGDDVRSLMRRFPAGVAVVTVDLDGEELGLTVGSLLSLSLEPPLVGVSIARTAAIHELLRRAGRFAVSLLAGGQEALAQHFARGVPPIALWQGIERRTSPGAAAPHLEGALGWLDCELWREYDAGDHTLFAARVVSLERGRAASPLVYVDGRYQAL